MQAKPVKPFMQIENWTTSFDREGRLRINGNVFNNPKFRDGSEIQTSRVESIVWVGDYYMVNTKNSVYLLK
jgi:hypothetical protein